MNSPARACLRGTFPLRPIPALLVALLLMSGCAPGSRSSSGSPGGGLFGGPRQGSTGAEATPAPSPLPDKDGIVLDPVNMAEFPCHRMGSTIMGRCNDADVARFRDEIFFMRTAEAETVKATPSPPATGDDIVVDPKAMADFPCHAMGKVIMGRCTDAEIARLKSEILALRARSAGDSQAVSTPTPALRLPGNEADPKKLTPAATSEVIRLADGDHYTIEAVPVARHIGDHTFPGYAYNGQIPGPLLRVKQGSAVTVDLHNKLDMPTTIHWHGLRQDAGSDGVPGLTQPAIQPGEHFSYALTFPDAGVYWYHPHIREDIQQDAGLYGMIIVEPRAGDFFNPVSHEEALVLDDLFIENGALAPYGQDTANHVIMGRFGNQMLVNGRPNYSFQAERGEVVRFYLLNVANVRPFRISFDGARIKRVGSDLGRYLHETWEESILIAPAERYVVEVLFDEARDYKLLHTTPQQTYTLGTINVTAADRVASGPLAAFDERRTSPALAGDVQRLARWIERPPDIELLLDVEIPGMLVAGGGPLEEGEHDDGLGVEWEDTMLAVNRQSIGRDAHWMIRDRRTGVANHDLAYSFRVGDLVKVRLVNNPASKPPMQHPIHIHGQRFLVTAVNGHPVDNPVWKDTVLVPIGATVDLVLEITNTGTWMVHCHIAEHLENGMMFNFTVTDGRNGRPGAPATGESDPSPANSHAPSLPASSHLGTGGHP